MKEKRREEENYKKKKNDIKNKVLNHKSEWRNDVWDIYIYNGNIKSS